MSKKELDEELKAYGILASKSNKEIRNYCSKIDEEIDESWDKKRFLNNEVWTDAIENQIEIIRLAEKLSIKAYRIFNKLD